MSTPFIREIVSWKLNFKKWTGKAVIFLKQPTKESYLVKRSKDLLNSSLSLISWRAASLSDRNMGENLSPIWPEGHCLNSAKHRPLTAWNHTWAEMRISFRGLLWSFIRHIFQPLILADTTKKLMRQTQLKKKNLIEWKSLQNSASVGKLVAV